MKPILRLATGLLLIALATAAQAHKRWLLPTDFSLSDAEAVTVDFTASNNIFYVDKPMPLAGVQVLTPSGELRQLLREVAGKRRGSFDVDVDSAGTWRVFDRGPPVHFISYSLPGKAQPVRARGTLEALRAALPAEATGVTFAESTALIETYITLGASSAPPALPDSDGLSVEFLSHPNELYSDEPAQIRVLLDGEPAPGLVVALVPEGTRYRDSQAQRQFTSDANGLVEVQWAGPGRYLLETAVEQPQPGAEIAMRYYGYFVTLEVLAP